MFLLYRSASGKSGKSVDNNKKSLVARRAMSSVLFLSTDEQDFTDFLLRIGVVRARVSASGKSG